MRDGYGPIPDAALFQHDCRLEQPVSIRGWSWSETFRRWSALVTFADGWHGYTWPKTWTTPSPEDNPAFTEIPQTDLARHCLQGPFFMTEAAAAVIEGKGIDSVLAWFNTKGQRVEVGDLRAIADTGLVAFFDFDADRPNGRAFYVTLWARNELIQD